MQGLPHASGEIKITWYKTTLWLQFSAKEICRSMANPQANDFMKIQRVVRLLKGIGGVKYKYKRQSEEESRDIAVHVDFGGVQIDKKVNECGCAAAC